MKCPYCQNQTPDNYPVCQNCGKKLGGMQKIGSCSTKSAYIRLRMSLLFFGAIIMILSLVFFILYGEYMIDKMFLSF